MRRVVYILTGLCVALFVIVAINNTKSNQAPITELPVQTSDDVSIILADSSSSSNANKPKENTQSKTVQASTKTLENSGKTPLKQIYKDGKVYPNRKYDTFITPDDPSYAQWWVATNNMTTVWDIPAGGYQTTVAVIDTGFALNHQEFNGRLHANAGETGISATEAPSDLNCTDQAIALDRSCNNIDDNYDGIVDNETGLTLEENPSKLNCTDQAIALDRSCNNIDDDDNGYVDDVSGWDFANFDGSSQAGQINPIGDGTTHGTMVAGVMAATGNNGVGIAGVNWHTKIMPIQALDDNSYGDSYTVGQSVYYAVDNGADIINISLGTSFDDPYMRAAVLYALDNNVLVVASSGNSGCNCMAYPANYPEVIAVGAINSAGNPASFSSYGSQLDILGPGQTMIAPTYSSSNLTSAYASNIAGTSFSAPFVSGLMAYGKMLQPDAKWEEIIGSMFENSDRRTNTFSSPRSNTLGYGVVKADTMLDRLITPKNYIQRVRFDDLNLGTKHNYQCLEGEIAASKFYELKKSGQVRYTSNLRELSKQAQLGWSVKDLGYTCVGLDFDSTETIRILNLPYEIGNTFIKTN